MSRDRDITRQINATPAGVSSSADIAAFVERTKAMSPHGKGARGRLMFALDATMSRQPTWDMACALQADMFREAQSIGSLDVRLAFYRGLQQCRVSNWISDSAELGRLMAGIKVEGGRTQIARILTAANRDAVDAGLRAVVFVGDAVEEPVDELCDLAARLGLVKVPLFIFQEGAEPGVETVFRELARLSGGAYSKFDPGSAAQLRELLRAAAAYASGGRDALMRLSRANSGAARLIGQMKS